MAEALIRVKTRGGSLGEEAPPLANPTSPWQPERDGYSGIRKPEEVCFGWGSLMLDFEIFF